MQQAQLTLEGMRQGVYDSQVFILVLSERVLLSWFCQQELLCAIELGKPIQLVIEEEQRFHPFSLTQWEEDKGGFGERMIAVNNAQGETEEVIVSKDDDHPWQNERTNEELAHLLCGAIDGGLSQAVTYRRRDFEQASMMHELCHRNGLTLPNKGSMKPEPTANEPEPETPCSEELVASDCIVFTICDAKTGGAIMAEIQGQILRSKAAVILT